MSPGHPYDRRVQDDVLRAAVEAAVGDIVIVGDRFEGPYFVRRNGTIVTSTVPTEDDLRRQTPPDPPAVPPA